MELCKNIIDAGNLRLATKLGFTIGSVYAPANIIKSDCAFILGNNFENRINDRIWFDYNYFIKIFCGNAGLQ